MKENESIPDSLPVRILVVDDHPCTAETLARALAQLGPGVDVISATSGPEALERLNEEPVDILITDMIMPVMTGLELIETLQKRPTGRPSYAFLITAYDVPGLQHSAELLKVNEVIKKPVGPEYMRQIASRALQEMHQVRMARIESTEGDPGKSRSTSDFLSQTSSEEEK